MRKGNPKAPKCAPRNIPRTHSATDNPKQAAFRAGPSSDIEYLEVFEIKKGSENRQEANLHRALGLLCAMIDSERPDSDFGRFGGVKGTSVALLWAYYEGSLKTHRFGWLLDLLWGGSGASESAWKAQDVGLEAGMRKPF